MGKTVAIKNTKIAGKKKDRFFQVIKLYVITMMIIIAEAVSTICANASTVNTSIVDSSWTQVKTFLQTWVLRLGGGVIVVGLIFFGMGFLRDDPDARTRGIQVIIGGAIVAAVAGLISTFM